MDTPTKSSATRFDWTPSKTKMLRTIANANDVYRVLRIDDFNRRDIEFFRSIGLCVIEDGGPMLTAAGRAKLATLPHARTRRLLTINRPVQTAGRTYAAGSGAFTLRKGTSQ